MLTITWATESTTRSPDGGDAVSGLDFQVLYLDGIISEGRNKGVDMSVHPIERAQDVTDHIHPKLQVITAECIVSDTPVNALVNEEDHVQAVEEQLDDIIDAGIPVDVEDDRKYWEQYIIIDMVIARDANTGDASQINLTFQQLKLADVEFVDAPAPSVERARGRQDNGRRQGQEGGEGTGSTDPSERQSTLRAARDAIQERGGISGVLGSLGGS